MMGFEPTEITAIRVAQGLGIGCEPQAVGEDPAACARAFRRAILSSQFSFEGVSVTDRGACSGCLSSLRHSLEALGAQDMLSRVTPLAVGLGVPCGAGELGRGMKVALGDCFITGWQGEADLKVPGCPPHAFQLYREIRRALLPEVPERF
jgi:hypothetical protein